MSEFAFIIGLVILVAFASSCTVQVSGTATGANCGSYPNCNETCCTNHNTNCYGSVDYVCAGLSEAACVSGDNLRCCSWMLPGPNCHQKYCLNTQEPHVGPNDCLFCGCDGDGDCDPITCADLTDNNPDVCPGCNTCGGDWDINDNRGLTPWAITVTGETHITTGGHEIVSGYRLTTGSIRTKPGALHVRPGTGGNIHVT